MLSIVIPVKDPEPYLKTLIDRFDKFLYGFDYEVLVQREKGLTNAVVQGVKRSLGEWILVMDGDGSHNPWYIPRMLQLSKSHDMVIGFKYRDATGPFRSMISKAFAFLANIILGIHLKDLSGFVMAKRELFKVVKPSLNFKFILPLVYLNPKAKASSVLINFQKRKAGNSKAGIKQAILIFSLILKLRTMTY